MIGPIDAGGLPYGADDSDNPEVRRWGTPRSFEFEAKAHWDLGPELGIIDFDRGVKLAGTRFYVLGGLGARLERALINFMIDCHNEAGFKEWWPPVITNYASLFGTGQLMGFQVIPEGFYNIGYENCGFMLNPPMALILIGVVIWIQRSKMKELQEK